MTEREVLEKQEENGQQGFWLIQIGSFIHAYGNGAFALARATGYTVRRKHRRMGDILTCGFPAERLGQVVQKIEEAGGSAELQSDGKTWFFCGIDGTPDEGMIKAESVVRTYSQQLPAAEAVAKEEPAGLSWLQDAVMGFNLSASTPLQAMMFIGELQKRIRKNEG